MAPAEKVPKTKDPAPELPQLFAVVSWGCAATAWIARILNAHPDVFCVHQANVKWSILSDTPRAADGLYMRIVQSLGRGHIAAGDVHGIDRRQIAALREEYGERFDCAVVVREPLSRLRSQFSFFSEFHARRSWGDLSYVDELAAKAGLELASLSYEQRLIIHGTNMLNAIVEERDLAPVWKCEDLTVNPEALCRFVAQLTRGKVLPDTEWAKQAQLIAPMNQHGAGGRELTDWHWHVIRNCVQPAAWNAYSKLGYEHPPELDLGRRY